MKYLLSLALCLVLALPALAQDVDLTPVTRTLYYTYLTQTLGFSPVLVADIILHSETVEGIELEIYSRTGQDIELPHLEE